MQDNSENDENFNLDQSIQHKLAISEEMKISSQNRYMNISKKWCRIENVYGKLELVAAPHFGIVLSTQSGKRSLTLIDACKNMNLWISAVGKNVKIDQVFVISEKFQNKSDNLPIEYLSLMVKWENVTVIETNPTQGIEHNQTLSPQNEEQLLNQSDDIENKTRPIVVHHVSTPFYVDAVDGSSSDIYCLVYISFVKTIRSKSESKLWLVLRRDQVAWREFLVPNREYRIHFPQKRVNYYFEVHQINLEDFFPGNETLKEILHHPDLFLTLNACLVPLNSKLYFSRSMEFPRFVLKLSKDSMNFWYSLEEAAQAEVELVSLYGQIDELLYTDDNAFFAKTCFLCNRGQPKKPHLKEPQWKEDHAWTNPWKTKKLGKFPYVEIPQSEGDPVGSMETGIPGKMVQVVKLRDTISGEQASLYLKHSVLRRSQQMCRLVPGLVVCVSHLNRRMSGNGRYYYIPTVLSALRILAYPETSQAVTSKIQVISNKRVLSLEKVLIKDEWVRVLLNIPKDIWVAFLEAATIEEIILFKRRIPLEGKPPSDLNALFNTYCNVTHRPAKMYICVRRLGASSAYYDGPEALYYCLQLEPMNNARLSTVAHLAKQAVKL